MTLKRRSKRPPLNEAPPTSGRGYPDLTFAIEQITARLDDVSASSLPILHKWLESLGKIQREMRHLERLEHYSDALERLKQQKDKD